MGSHRPRRAAYLFCALALLLGVAGLAVAKTTKKELKEALKDNDLVGDWNYDDIGKAFRRAKKEKRPVCVVFR